MLIKIEKLIIIYQNWDDIIIYQDCDDIAHFQRNEIILDTFTKPYEGKLEKST